MATGQGADDVEGFIEARHRGAALEQDADSLDESGWSAGEVGEGALLDLAGLAIGLAEQDGGRGGSVGDGFDVHGYASCTLTTSCQNHFSLLHGYNRHSTNPETLRQINCLARMSVGNQGELRFKHSVWRSA